MNPNVVFPPETTARLKRQYEEALAEAGVEWGRCFCGCGEPTPRARQGHLKKGYVKGMPTRFAMGHANTGQGTAHYRAEDRGYATPCWIWSVINGEGYGNAWLRGRQVRAHRLIYERHKGPIPSDLQLDHLCRQRACVNPDHLEPVTCKENIRRGHAARKGAK